MTKSAQSKYRTKYRILGLVGSGQFGRVFCARDRQTNQLVALKELEPRRFPTHKFLRELRFLISLSHINIVRCISVDYNQNHRYLVMEYCEAGTLRNLLESSNLIEVNLEQRSQNLCIYLNLIIEILSGLKYAHSLNIIHCDLKPENILLKLTATGWQPKISDFGISQLAQESGKYDNTGSPAYMAPERFYGQFSVASDLYAVGIILYELMVKERPFLGNPTELMFAHINQRINIPDYIPNALKIFLHKALEKLPARRFSSAENMQTELHLLMATNLPSELLNTDQIEFNKYKNKSNNSDAFIAEKQLLEPIVAFGFLVNSPDTLNFYTATEYLLKKSNLGSILNHQTSHKFNDKITDLVIIRNQEFVITNHSIYRISNNFQDPQILYSSNQNFHWAIADQWLAILEQNSSKLQIQYLSDVYTPKILDLPKTSIVALLKITDHHLALISNSSQGSNIWGISRRGCLMANFDLDISISMAIASYEGGRILLATNLDYLVLVDWKPYRVIRIDIGYKPQLIKATKWGYIATKEGETTTLLNFMDTQCNYVGGFVVTGLVKAIACLNDHILIISLKTPIPSSDASIVKILILDLKQLELDLVF